MHRIIPKLNAACEIIAPDIEPERFFEKMKKRLTRYMLMIQINAGINKNLHLSLIKTNPKWEICVNAKAELSTREARVSPNEFAKLAWGLTLVSFPG